ncbi:CPBP family intramembrane glutamic endopeptidase [Pelagicoccus albus]|uniref:CPBP family intramembrane metalloprotease n=1 Tax=Pelagicoccus albus TaxID=415222 RepID=A0A7X1B5C3_9BACT|nr:CPBP family intramembrane glutamic endopeptidase [Pelagicoccus albus]MBC2604680.1 CPBP family intramembrane metalloprotease [Pelagicoccus albus]
MFAETIEQPNPSPRPGRLPKWEIRGSDFGLFAAMLFACMALASALFGQFATWLLAPEEGGDPPLLAALAANLGMQFGMLAAFLGFLKILDTQGNTSPRPDKAPIPQAISIGFKWLLIAYPVMIAVNLISRASLNQLGFEQVIQDPILMVQQGGSWFETAIMYAMISLVAPICEEAAFRGGVFRYLHHRLPLFASLGLSAFFFAILHANLYSFAPLMTIGVMLALAYRESGSLLSCIVFHSAFNTINLVLILFVPDLT